LLRTTHASDLPDIVVNNPDGERSEFHTLEIRYASRPGEIWGRSEMEGTLRKTPYALAHAHSRRFEANSKKNKKGPRKKVVDLLGELYVGSMKTKVAKKQKRPGRQKAKSV
jgi:hypothetical protein